MESILEAITQSELVQLDSGRDVVFETPSTDVLNTISQYFEDPVSRFEDSSAAKPYSPVSDSDSGDSLFLTQAVSPVLRAVKRHRSSERSALLINSESDDENEAVHNSGVRRLHKPRPAYVQPKRTEFPFLQKCKKFRFGRLPVCKNQVLVNSEIGGFFKCVQKISQGHEVQRTELSPAVSSSVREEESVEEGSKEEDHGNDDDDDIRVVDAECFIFNTGVRNRQPWLPKTRWTVRLNKKKKEEKNKQKQKSQKQKGAKGKTGVQKQKAKQQTEIQKRSRTNKTSQCNSRTEKQKSGTTVSRNLVSSPECSSMRHLLLDQEEHSEKQLDVLATCSQSVVQVVDHHFHSRSHSAHQSAETCAANVPEGELDDERMVEETQMPDSDQTLVEAEETHVLEMVEDRSKKVGEDGRYLENLPFREPRESDKDPGEEGHHEVQDHEDCGDSIGSADLFGEEGNQFDELIDAPSLTDEIRPRDGDENQESCVVQCDEGSPVRVENTVAKQAEIAIETESPLFNYGGMTFLKWRKRKTSETSEVSHSLLSDAGQYNRSSTYDDACGQKKRKTSSHLDKDGKGEEEKEEEEEKKRSLDVRLSQEPAQASSISEANFPTGAKENWTVENNVQSWSYSSDETCIEEDNQITRPTSEGLLSVAAAAAVTEPEPSTASKLSTPVRTGEEVQQDDGSPAKSLVQSQEFEPLNTKKAKNANDMQTMDYAKQVESSLGTTTQKPVETSTQPGFLENNDVERPEREDISPSTSTQSDHTVEPLKSCDEEANREKQIFCKDIQSVDLVTPKKTKTKKKRQKIVEESLDPETSHIETTGCDEQQVTELVPEKQHKKKKRKREHDVEENLKITEASSIETTKQGEEKILEKKKIFGKAYHVKAAEKSVEVVQDSEKQTTELVQENKMKKKKKKKREHVVGNNIGVEATEQVESLEVVQYIPQHIVESIPEKKNKKKQKEHVIENNVGVETCQLEEAELVEEVLEDSVKQTPESVTERKLKKKKEQVVENNLGVEATETAQALEGDEACPVEAAKKPVEVFQDSKKQTTESVSDNKLEKKKKKKNKQVFGNNRGVQSWQVEAAKQVEVLKDSVQQTTELVSEKKMKQKKSKRDQVVENNVDDEACPVEAAKKNVEVVQYSEKQTTESVPDNKLKKKKKNKSEQVIENNMDVEAYQVEVAEQIVEVLNDYVKQTTESVPEKKMKKKKKEQVVENNVGVKPAETVNTLEVIQYCQQTTESIGENKMKKRKKNKRDQVVQSNVGDKASHVEAAERTVEVFQDSEKQTTQSVSEKKLKKKKEKLVENNLGDYVTESVPEKKIKKKKKKEQIKQNDVGVKPTETVENVQKTSESVPENKRKKKNKKEQVDDEACPVKAAEKTVEEVLDSEKQTESVPKKKLKKKKERLVENNEGDEVCSVEPAELIRDLEVIQHHEQKAAESVPKKKLKKKKKKEQFIENNVDVKPTETIKALEVVQYHQQTTESVPENKMKKKKNKRDKGFGNNVGDEACPVEAAKKTVAVVQYSEKQTTESVLEKKMKKKKVRLVENDLGDDHTDSVPEKKIKKKKKKGEHVETNVGVEACYVEATDQVEALELVQPNQQQGTEFNPEIKGMKKKKKKKREQFGEEDNVGAEACPVQSTDQIETFEVVQHYQHQATESDPDKRVKKKKKRKSFEVFQNNMTVDFCEVIQDCVQEAAELVPKKKQKTKKKKGRDVEGTVDVEAIYVATAEHVETLELVQEAEQQCPELDSEIKVDKKIKKKKKKPEDVEENVDVRASSSSKQVDALELKHDFEQESVQLVPERKKLKGKKKKKRKQDADDNETWK
ncbi:hypothetical protein AMEX_G668 [Astyanax mexicanus]|uniref:Uncharacterized protein n=1 Tax=Astyanax mexicanus TaxID=7994 RepID=A0A8T2MFX1_ASTMX|nr:hypothetical protein AMEX_G668 [Astyanax mexicanus]